MNTLHFLLTLGLLGYSLYSIIAYAGRRSRDKAALRDHRDASAPVRDLTEAERSALQPFLVNPLKTTTSVTLAREGVFQLHGEYVRHGIKTSNGGEAMHDTIGGVDVLLPYDARDFLTEHCSAEVVFTEKFAIVIGLESGFDLPSARERARRKELQNQQWSQGKVGDVIDVGQDPDTAIAETAGPSTGGEPSEAMQSAAAQAQQGAKVRILGQRDETPAELAQRQSPGLGLLAAGAWGLFFVGLCVASAMYSQDARWGWTAAGLLFGALAVWLSWRRRQAGPLQKVNRVSGHLHVVALAVNGQISSVQPKLFLGDKFPLNFPDHWRELVTVSEDPVEVDMRVDDHAVLSYNKYLSIDSEVRESPPVFWGRHLALTCTGVLTALALLIFTDSLRADLLLTWSRIRQGEALVVEPNAAMLADPPLVGTAVTMSGQARCDVPDHAAEPAQMNCARLRWKGATPTAQLPEIDALTLSLKSGNFLDARSNPMLDMLANLRRRYDAADPYGLARYRDNENAPKIVRQLPLLIQTMQQACEPPKGAREAVAARLRTHCERWTSLLTQSLNEGADTQRNWDGWQKAAADGQLTGNESSVLMSSREVTELRDKGRDIGTMRMNLRWAELAQNLRNTQRGGLVVQVAPQPDASHWPTWSDQEEPLQALAALMKEDSLHPFEVNGVLTGVSRDEHGDLVIMVDASRSLANLAPSALRSACLLVALLLTLVHGTLLVLRWRAAAKRALKIQALNQQQLARYD